MSISRKDLVKSVSNKLGTTQVEANKWLQSYLEEIRSQLANGEVVNLIGIAKFYKHAKKATIKRNPKTGAKINVPAKTIAKCKLTKFFN